MKNNFMQVAIEEAKKSNNEIPVGAVIVKNGKIISKAHNQKEATNDVTAHAEIVAIREAEKFLNNWRLENCEIYITLEPCPMCGWAILQSRISKLYFGSFDNNYGAFSSKIDLQQISNNKLQIYGGIEEDACDEILHTFFSNARKI